MLSSGRPGSGPSRTSPDQTITLGGLGSGIAGDHDRCQRPLLHHDHGHADGEDAITARDERRLLQRRLGELCSPINPTIVMSMTMAASNTVTLTGDLTRRAERRRSADQLRRRGLGEHDD